VVGKPMKNNVSFGCLFLPFVFTLFAICISISAFSTQGYRNLCQMTQITVSLCAIGGNITSNCKQSKNEWQKQTTKTNVIFHGLSNHVQLFTKKSRVYVPFKIEDPFKNWRQMA
jgi:hypothetical protein